jgi:transglutaminase-like putative cysteine protease
VPSTHAFASFAIVPLLAASCNSVRTYETSFHSSFAVVDIPERAREVSVWVPLPVSNEFQEITGLTITPAPAIVREPEYGNTLAHLTWKAPFSGPLEVTLSYDLRRREEVAHREETPQRLMRRYLEPDQLGVIDDRIRAWSGDVTRGKAGTVEKARAIYDFVLAHMTYDKSMPGWGRGDTLRACDTRSGNCSDFHSLFISLARAAEIPARFHYGFSLAPDGAVGPHCWAEFHDSERGWVPVDISEADKDPSRSGYYFGRLSENRVNYTVGRDLVLTPPQKGPPLNFLIDPYVEVDGRPHAGLKVEARHGRPGA